MARTKTRQRISYVLPLAKSAGGHRLGVNGLDVDSANSILYSGGRDGVICAWDLHLDLEKSVAPEIDEKLPPPPATTFRQQVQAHTHWINDIALAHSNQALLSASSDITVKVWRPWASDGMPPQPVGLHSDYVKTLAVPSATSDWFVSGGLDRKICAWDLNGGGQKLCINVGDDEAGSLSNKDKGSVYALAAKDNILASGGPESTVRVWDARSGKRITKLVGHTDNIRDVLVSQDDSTILTASSDRTVKVWSTVAGRCMYTLTMHDSSVWSLYSSDPDLSVFYSSDKAGTVAKTDTRDVIELDDGISVSVCQEHEGVHKVIAAGDSIWTATSRPSINRWRDVNTDNAEIEIPENYTAHRGSIMSGPGKFRYPSPPNQRESVISAKTNGGKRKLPLKHMLRLSHNAYFPTPIVPDSDRRGSVATERRSSQTPGLIAYQPVRIQPDYSIEGQNGLIKHVMLNDRKRVLTLDTAGEVVMWDLLKCVPIKSFGKRHLDDVKDEVTTVGTVANWCTVDTRTGSVAVILEEHTCFDAEMYADELDLDPGVEYREDQRINLGKWVLRYLFDNVITEEVKRDEAYRKALLGAKDQQRLRENAPSSIEMPGIQFNEWHADATTPQSATTLKATNGTVKPTTPGMGIGAATPGIYSSPAKSPHVGTRPLSPTFEEGEALDKAETRNSHSSVERPHDYFSNRAVASDAVGVNSAIKTPMTPAEGQEDATAPNNEANKDTPQKEGLFGKKFRRGMSFGGMKKIGRTQTNDKEKPAVVEEKEKDKDGSESEHSSKTDNSRVVDENLSGSIQKIRFQYEDNLQKQLANRQAFENGLPVERPADIGLQSLIRPALPDEAPVLRPPPNTTILIQEERPEAGGVADLFEGTVGSLGEMCDVLEKAAPMWLGEVLLRNQTPIKDVVKVSFILEPWQNALPAIATDGNNRLNANRMLRAKKVLGYVAERIESTPPGNREEADDSAALKPEEYLELWCQNQIVPPSMTLATIRAHLWRGGGDVILYYKANGRKAIRHGPLSSSGASGIPPSNTATTGVSTVAAEPSEETSPIAGNT